MKNRRVLLTADAARDLSSLYEYVAVADSRAKAERVLERIQAVIASIARIPERGSPPKELLALGNKDYRQVFFKPYRIIYRAFDEQVIVFLIADGRRDFQSLLTRRLLEG